MENSQSAGSLYLPRVLDSYLAELLESAGAVLIEGPRGCGKTETALHNCASHIALDTAQVEQWRTTYPDMLLDGPRPRLLDEWQVVPEIWNLVRRDVDARRQPGQFILTGSAVPDDDTTRHTGTARFLRTRLYTMSWYERGLSTNTVSLARLFSDPHVGPDAQRISLAEGAEYVCASGYPGLLRMSSRAVWRAVGGILEETTHSDMARIADVRHSPSVVSGVIRSLARTSASETSYRTIAADVRALDVSLSPETVARYVELLERIFVVDRQPAWAPRAQSRARLRTSPKWHLADPALAARALGLRPEALSATPEVLGLLFESAVVHDLRVFAAAMDAQMFHFRDSNGQEIDAVVECPDGSWGAIEVKLSEAQVPQAAQRLHAITSQMLTPPSFRLVVTLTGHTLQLPDGTITCPLTALGP